MNKDRRKKLSQLQDRIEAQRAVIDALKNEVSDIADDLETLRDEEQDAFDNLPENMQQGERGQDMEAAIGSLTNAWEALDGIDLEIEIDDIISNIEDGRGQA